MGKNYILRIKNRHKVKKKKRNKKLWHKFKPTKTKDSYFLNSKESGSKLMG